MFGLGGFLRNRAFSKLSASGQAPPRRSQYTPPGTAFKRKHSHARLERAGFIRKLRLRGFHAMARSAVANFAFNLPRNP